ncbi:hypothetical protein EP7_004307 [Isosphaeraceae bacterium EP7]
MSENRIQSVFRDVMTHRNAKGEAVFATKEYLELSQEASRDYEQKMQAQGFRKVPVAVSSTRQGYVWERTRQQSDEEHRNAKAGCAPTEKPRRTDLPPAAERAKSVASGLDDGHDWATAHSVLDDLGRLPKTEKTPPANRYAAPTPHVGERFVAQVRDTDLDSPPPIPVEVLRAQERDADLLAARRA